MVNLFSWKDYELHSWNEQGKITKVEGMLTIAFSFIFLCSHIDVRKELYLIMKIPYTVSMSTNEYADTKKDVKIIKGDPLITPELYHQQNEKIKELSLKIEKLESEIQLLKSLKESVAVIIGKDMGFLHSPPMKLSEMVDYLEDMNKRKFDKITELFFENRDLKEKLGIVESKWQFEVDLAWRNNPVTGDFEQFGFPSTFLLGSVENFYFKDKSKRMCHFGYKLGSNNYKEYDMPYSLFNELKKNAPDKILNKNIMKQIWDDSKKEKKIDIHSIDKLQDAKKYIYSTDNEAKTTRKYFNQTFNYLLHNRESKFKFEDYKKSLNFPGRQIGYDLLRDFEKWGFVKKAPNKKGYWNVIF